MVSFLWLFVTVSNELRQPLTLTLGAHSNAETLVKDGELFFWRALVALLLSFFSFALASYLGIFGVFFIH
jgi:hypothetical protein